MHRSQGHPRAPETSRGLGQSLPWHLLGEPGLANTSVLDFWPPELGDNTFLGF